VSVDLADSNSIAVDNAIAYFYVSG